MNKWGPTHSSDYPRLMAGILAIGLIGVLSGISPFFEAALSVFFGVIFIFLIVRVVTHLLRERHLDWEAQYGELPLPDEEDNHV